MVERENKEENRARKEQQKQAVSLELLLGGSHNWYVSQSVHTMLAFYRNVMRLIFAIALTKTPAGRTPSDCRSVSRKITWGTVLGALW